MAHTRIRSMTQIALCTALLAMCAWLTVPATVPFTLQSFGVALTLLLLGGRDGGIAIAVYLLLGLVGLPVFAGGGSGMGVLFSLNGGYLLGFLASALPVLALPRRRVLGVLLGMPLSYLTAAVWITLLFAEGRGFEWTLTVCILPYVIPDIFKLAAAIAVSRRLKKLV